MSVDSVREVVCRVLRVRPDPNNWSAGNVEGEVYGLLGRCEWFYVYDAIELLGAWLSERQGGHRGGGWRRSRNHGPAPTVHLLAEQFSQCSQIDGKGYDHDDDDPQDGDGAAP